MFAPALSSTRAESPISHAAARLSPRRLVLQIADDDRAAEAVADAVNRPDPGGFRGAVVESLPDLVDERLQARFGDEGVGPDPRVDPFLGNCAGLVLEQEQEQIECLAGEVQRRRRRRKPDARRRRHGRCRRSTSR
jgi:hypothetical protein